MGAFHGQAMLTEGDSLSGKYKGGLSLHDYLLVTDKRVIFWTRGLITGSTDGFFYNDISSTEKAKTLLLGEIVLNVRGTKERFRSMVKKDVPNAIQLIQEQISKSRTKKTTLENKRQLIPDQIRKLIKLRDDGLLTEEKFLIKKRELLK